MLISLKLKILRFDLKENRGALGKYKILCMDTIIEHFEIESALRGFHVYKNTEKWTPVKGQQLKHFTVNLTISMTDLLGEHYCLEN